MNVYDFDGTIYDGDSTVDFYLYCLRRHPKLFVCIFRQSYAAFLKVIGKIDTTSMKNAFFSFLPYLDDTEALVNAFWRKHKRKIKKWYLEQKKSSDVVISASPEFLLKPVCDLLGTVSLIATRVDIRNGKIQGQNCKGDEKVRRFYEQYPDGEIDRFYSDSATDAPLAAVAKEAFFVKNDSLCSWSDDN